VVVEREVLGKVAEEAYSATGSSVMFVTQVGHEDAPHRVLTGSTASLPSAAKPSRGQGEGQYSTKLSNRALYPVLGLPTRGVIRNLTATVSYLVDTGADISAVSPSTAARLRVRLSPVGRMRITGWAGESSLRTLYLTVFQVAKREIFAAVDAEADICVLGRDVLNEFRLVASPRENRLSLETVEEGDSAAARAREAPTDAERSASGPPAAGGWWATEDQLLRVSGGGDAGPTGRVSYAVVLGAAIAGASIYAGGKEWIGMG